MSARKYTTEQLAELAKMALQENPAMTRQQLRIAIGVNADRMRELSESGLVELPRKLSRSEAARRARAAGGWRSGIKLSSKGY